MRSYLSELEMFVLAAVVRLGDRAYGVEIRRAIEERGGRPLNIGTLYATLARLETRGLVETWKARPELQEPGSRSRRYAQLTPQGRKLLAATADAMSRMLDDLELAPGKER